MDTQIGYCIDWISGTKIDGGFDLALILPDGLGHVVADARPQNGYNKGVITACGAIVLWHTAFPDMGWHMVMSGAALREIRAAGMDDRTLVRKLSARGIRFSRIDLAMDVFNSEWFTPYLFKGLIEEKRFKTRARLPTFTSGVGNVKNGATLYLGARTSPRMARIYDKAAESGVDGLVWTRIEFELKEERAQLMQNVLVTQMDVQTAFTATWKGYTLQCDDERINNLIGSTTATMPDIPRKAHNTIAWLLDQVVPAMINFQTEHPEVDILELMSNAYKSYKS